MTQSTNANIQDQANTPNWKSKSQPLPGITHAVSDLSRRPKLVFTILGTVVALVAVVSLFSAKKEEKESKARNELYGAKKTLDSELKSLATSEAKTRPMSATLQESIKAAAKAPTKAPTDPKAPKPDAAAMEKENQERHVAEILDEMAFEKMDVDAKLPGGVKALAQVHQDYSGSTAGFEAALTLGNLYFAHEAYEKAVPWFEKAVKSAPHGMDKTLSQSALGYALENTGNKAAATAVFEEAMNSAQGAPKAELLLTVARLKAGAGDGARAKNLYDAVIKDFAGTEYAKKAEEKKAQLK